MKVVVAVIVAVAACAPPDRGPRWKAAGATEPRDGGTLHIAVKDGVSTLDPTIAYDETSFYVLRLLYETLLDYEPHGTGLVPRLAERYEVSSDATTFSFWLRPGLRYSDGAPILATDIKYSLERALTAKDSLFAQSLADVVGADAVIAGATTECAGITATDREIVIRLARPNTSFLYTLAMPFTTPQRAAHVAETKDRLRRTPLSSGPFVLGDWDEGVRITLRRNPAYAGAREVHLDAIEITENVPRDTQFLMFERGDIDVIDRLAAPDLLWVMSQPAWTPYVHSQPMLVVYGGRFDVTQKPFTDRRVRQAFNYALDKRHTTKLLTGTSMPSHGMLPPGTFGRDDALQPYPHDPAKARALLADAGFPDGLAVEFVTLADEDAEKVAASMQGDFAEVGIDLRISLVTLSAYASMYGTRGGPAFAYAGWIGDTPQAGAFLDKFHSRGIADRGATNDSFYANAEVDALLDAARADGDAVSRAARYREVERILYADAPWLWNYHQVHVEVTQPYVRGYAPHPVWLRDFATTWLDVGADGLRVPQ